MSRDEFAEEAGSYGRCPKCKKRSWFESGCAQVCDSCGYGENEEEPDTEEDPDVILANLGLSAGDF